MNKIIVFIVVLVLLLASAYFSFHVVLKENIFNEWYEYLCYASFVIVSVMVAKDIDK